MAYLPAGWGGEVRYVAILISHEPRDFDAEAMAFAETLANQAAAALALLESEQRRAARAERDAALTRAAVALGSSLELVEVLETFAREADLAMGGALAGVYLADGSGGGVATAGHNVHPEWTGIVLSRGEGVAGRVLTTGEPFVTNAYQTEIETAHESLGGIQTAAGVPMVWNGELKGALSVGFTEMRRVTEEDLRTLRGDRRARGRGLPQRRGLPARPRRGRHRLAHRADEPRRAARPRPRGDLPRPPRRRRRSPAC